MLMNLVHEAVGFAPDGFSFLEYIAALSIFLVVVRQIFHFFGYVIMIIYPYR